MQTAKKSGWGKGGVYNGFVVSCVGIIFYRGAYFGLYDTSQTFIQDASFATKFAISYTVTVVAGLLSYPLDTIRRRMMMTSGGDAGKYTSSIDCFNKILKTEGVKSMFKGAGSNVLRGLCGALVLVGFDYVTDYYLKWRYGAWHVMCVMMSFNECVRLERSQEELRRQRVSRSLRAGLLRRERLLARRRRLSLMLLVVWRSSPHFFYMLSSKTRRNGWQRR